MCQHKLLVDILKDEKWFGGLVSDGINAPYKKGFYASLMNTLSENQSMPLLLSDKGRFIYGDKPFDYKFLDNKIVLHSNEARVELYEGFDNLKGAYLEAMSNFFPFKEDVPPPILFTNPQYNTWIELMYNQSEENILKYAQNIVENGYPSGILMIDDNWQEDYGVFDFHKGRFNNPKSMIKKLHDMGFRVMLWISPFISADSSTYRELSKKNFLIKTSNGEDFICKWWNGYSALLDCTNPETVKWFHNQLNRLIDKYEVDGFKMDAGDAYFYQKELLSYKNINSQEHCRSYAEIGMKYQLCEYRTSYKMAGMPIAQRLCDKSHTWGTDGLASLIPNGLAQGIIGYAYNCPDMIGGGQYENFLPGSLDIDEELVVRYAQCSALFPMMQYSVAPWRVLSKKHASICKEMANLHMRYGEYINELAVNTSKTGEPIMRMMSYEFGSEYSHILDQFMLGDKILVAPVITQNTYMRNVTLPDGMWIDDLGKIYQGPRNILTDVPIERLPFYTKV